MSNSTNKLFAKLGHGFADDPKIIGLSDKAFRVYVESLLYACSNMTDGFLDERVLRRYGWLDAAEELTTNDDVPSWVKAEGGYQIHAFCDWQMTTERHAKQVANGRAGGIAKAKNRQQASEVVAGASEVLAKTASENVPDKELDIDKDKELKPLAIASPLFDEFWQLWPRREGKANAVKAWQKATKKISESDLVEKARAYVTSPTLPQAQFVPHAATWLNGERYNDEPEPPKWNPDAWMNEDVKWGDARFENAGDDR
jgi:hypothetical protein